MSEIRPWWHWPANRHETYAPWWEIARHLAVAPAYFLLVVLLVVVVMIGWGRADAARVFKGLL